jgi:outer membrane protein insertion porin family
MKRVVFVLLMILTVSSISAQEDEWYVGKVIKDFSFVGLKTVTIGELRPIVRPYIGQLFTMELFWEVQGKLFALDYFDEINAEAKPADEQKLTVVIEFKVRERPSIREIKIDGNRRVSRGTIMDKILLKKGDFVTEADVNLDVENIKELYLEKGFPNIEVEGKQEIDEEKNEVTVAFRITEGAETKVKKIYFSGNSFASEGTLKWHMKTKEQSVFVGGNFQESVLQEDVKLIEDYYKEHGYIDAKVLNIDREIEWDEKNNRTFLILTVFIEEGEQYLFGGMSFEGNEIFTTEELEKEVKIKPGTVLNMQKVENAFQRVVRKYSDNGYIYNIIERQEERDEENKLISFHIKIQEFDKAHIESIILQGNDRTKDYVILRELPFEVGDIFSVQKIHQGVFNLYNLQYFSTVDVKPVTGTVDGLMDLVLNVEEQSWADFRFAISFSGGDFPLAGSVGWTDRNFLGTGRTIGVDVEASVVKQGVAFRFNDPHLFMKDWGGGFSLAFSHNLIKDVYQDIIPPLFTDEDVPDPYTSEDEWEDAISEGIEVPAYARMDYHTIDISTGVNTKYTYRTLLGNLGVSTGLTTTITYLWYDPDLYRPYSQNVRENLYTWNFINTWGTTLFWDKRDIFYNPTSGWYLAQYVGFTGGFLFGARHYIKLQSRAEQFLTLWMVPLSENFDFGAVLAVHSSISFLLPQFGDIFEVTPKDTLAIDGMVVGRGWPYQYEFKALWESSLEIRQPLLKKFIWWVWFFDVVGAWPEISMMGDMTVEDYYFGWGFGLRFTIPGFPIRLYLSRNFRVENGEVVWEPGDFTIGPHGFKFVIAFTQPGGF